MEDKNLRNELESLLKWAEEFRQGSFRTPDWEYLDRTFERAYEQLESAVRADSARNAGGVLKAVADLSKARLELSNCLNIFGYVNKRSEPHEREMKAMFEERVSEITGILVRYTSRIQMTDMAADPSSRTGTHEVMSVQAEVPQWHFFLCHASEDKISLARPLANALREAGLSVWFDEFELKVGDSLRRSIDRGLSAARFGIVILSHSFFAKNWPQRELDGLSSRESDDRKVILPILHGLTTEDLLKYSPMLADKYSLSSASGVPALVSKLTEIMR